ncbi:TonB-dependent receptor plug domain-containing protein [Horticoccus sp. 23ND18S-11]|uniref:TonB-dependent receptor plug domain-containing protein n=1 Tax=Horticoccus sp. 23ND18S-11 TaxID=3391832 RepID=UPI0039C94C2D
MPSLPMCDLPTRSARLVPATARRALGAGFFLLPLLTLTAAESVVTPAAAANAAKGPTKEEVVALQSFVVTGSNIKRLDMEKIVPVTVLGFEAMTARNAFTPVDMLTSLPQLTSLPENETRTGSSGARGDNANINLRNLGATGTLILINGRRMAVNPMTAGLSQAVNVNQLPTQGVERVEVLRDGASAIYGSDAVGGVVNYVMRRDFRGAEATLRYGVPEGKGGQYSQASFTFGQPFASGRGRILGTVEYLYREAIYLRDREFSASSNVTSRVPAPFNALGGAFDARTPRGRYPTFLVGTSTANNYFRIVNGAPALTTVAPTRPANPEFYLDLNELSMAQPRANRFNSFFSAEFDLTKEITAFADLSYYKSKSTMVRQPLALNAPTTDQLAVLAIGNPYNPYGSRFYDAAGAPNADGTPRLTGAPRTVSLVSLTLQDLPVEEIKTDANVVRITAGLKGKIADSWTWEVAGFYNRARGDDAANNDVRESLFQQTLQRTDASAYNPFGYTFRVQGNAVVADQPYKNPASVVSAFAKTFARNAQSYIASADARATGRLFTLWSGEVRAAVGAEHRAEDLKDLRPPFSGENPAGSGLDPLNNDFLLHPPRPDVRGDRKVTSYYAEVVVPLVSPKNRIPFAQTLELTASGRREHYSDFGDTTKPKFGVNWRPVQQVMVRGSYNEGFMAPSLAALYTSPRWSITAGAGDIDIYRNPVTNEGPYVQRNYFGGNASLKASESKGKTAGVVIDVPGVKGLSITADYWQIRRVNLLGQRSSAQVFASDTALLQTYVKEQIAAGRPVGSIDLGSGTSAYKGDQDIVRLAPTAADIAAFAAYNAANPGNPQAVAGRIFSNNTPFLNLASSHDEGVDLGLSYVLPKLRIGYVTLNSDWSYLTKSRTTTLPTNVAPITTDNVNVNGAARWRGTSTVAWRNGSWSGSLGAYYAGATQDSGATTTQAVYDSLGQPAYIARHFTEGRFVYRYRMHDSITFNTSVGYRFGAEARWWLRQTRVRLGVVNLADATPPVASGQFGYSPSVTGSLAVGRTWTLELTRAF